MPRTYLKVPFSHKEAAKSLGAKWDWTVTSWYVPEGVDVSAFSAWVNGSLSAVATLPAASSSTTLTATGDIGSALAIDKSGISLSKLLAGVASAVAAAYRTGVWTTNSGNAYKGEIRVALPKLNRSLNEAMKSLLAVINGLRK